ncbi:hypothetical protein EPO17_02325 [Patescibacteria group bacterium]|nr:MAG: hypothetical protein EPO17_02325 [Patescibacteria group bacterium]
MAEDSAVLDAPSGARVGLESKFFEVVACESVPGVGRVAFLRSRSPRLFEGLDMRILYNLYPPGTLVTGDASLRRAFYKLPMEFRETPLVPLGEMLLRRIEFRHQPFKVFFKDGQRINTPTWGITDLAENIFLVVVRTH